jgi:starch synthase (maltosyl-transferring)
VYQLCENQPRAPGIEEGIDNEKYEIRVWDVDQPHSLAGFIGTINAARHAHRALQLDWNLHFHPIDNDQLLFYSKHTDDRDDIILVAVNLDPRGEQSGWVHLDLEVLGIGGDEIYQVHDQLTGETYSWRGAHNFIRLAPNEQVAHILAVARGETPSDTRY